LPRCRRTAEIKLAGPPAPDEITAATGADRLVVHFAYETVPVDQIINGYQFYCDPPPGAQSVADAGASAAAACDGSPSSVLLPGSTAVDGAYVCGSASKDATSATIADLVNQVPYNVAVAAIDPFQNVGPLSPVTCGVPMAPGKDDRDVKACSFSPHCAYRRVALAPLELALTLTLTLTLVGCRRARRRTRARRAVRA
jgi:hypothetical protein